MNVSGIRSWLALTLCLASAVVSAQDGQVVQPIQMTHCLAAQLSPAYPVLAADARFKIVNVPLQELDRLALLADKAQCGRFVNVAPQVPVGQSLTAAQAQHLLNSPRALAPVTPAQQYQIQHQEAVHHALDLVEPFRIQDTLSQLVAFQNRAAALQTGVDAAQWLKAQYDAMATDYGRSDAESFFVDTGRFKQPSLVTVLGKDQPGPAIVIGAHMDTLGATVFERMPGAGDDGSGSATVMEIARVLMASNFAPKRPVYIIWYAAEEMGLVGSQYVVAHFMRKNIAVQAAIQFDMTGYRNRPDDPSMWLFRDYTDKALTAFNAELIETYVKVPVKYSHCGYGCSDHASWHAVGVPAVFPCETSFEQHNPYIHSANDTMDLLSLEHMSNFTRLGVAFAIELAGA
ncbi:MAG: M20/M25/M40 family metallo-hydrolase [Legionellaceae bacterium]|nr:M20/M25/M40 family metallo-hydrolase [Legionellaceae bacterium]